MTDKPTASRPQHLSPTIKHGVVGRHTISTLAASHTTTLLHRGARTTHALTSGYDLAFTGAACSVVVALLLSALRVRTSASIAKADDEHQQVDLQEV